MSKNREEPKEEQRLSSKEFCLKALQNEAEKIKAEAKDPETENKFVGGLKELGNFLSIGVLLKMFHASSSFFKMIEFALHHKALEDMLRICYQHLLQSAGQLINKLVKELQKTDEAVFEEFDVLLNQTIEDFAEFRDAVADDNERKRKRAQARNKSRQPDDVADPFAGEQSDSEIVVGTKSNPVELSAYLKPVKLEKIGSHQGGISFSDENRTNIIDKGAYVGIVGFVSNHPGLDCDDLLEEEFISWKHIQTTFDGAARLMKRNNTWVRITVNQSVLGHEKYNTWQTVADTMKSLLDEDELKDADSK